MKFYRILLSTILLISSACGHLPVYAQTQQRAPDGLTRIAQDEPFNKQRPPAPLSVARKREIEQLTKAILARTLQTRASAPNATSDSVVFPSPEVEFIIGAQLKSGSAQNPWTFFDANAIAKGHEHGIAFPAIPPAIQPNGYAVDDGGVYQNRNYYDQALAQYINYYRTGDVKFRDYARKIADSWCVRRA